MRQAAHLAQINPSTISRWESGQTRPSAIELEAVMKVLHVPLKEQRRVWELLGAPRALARLQAMDRAHSALVSHTPMPGELLKAMRLRQGWTLEQTAFHLQVSAPTLSRWERSEIWPSTENLHALCQVLNAREEEVIALSRGPQVWLYDNPLVPSDIDSLKQMTYDDSSIYVPNIELPLMDLFCHSLEARLCQLLRQGQRVRPFLISAYVRHATFLLHTGRLKEAQTPAYRALHLIQHDQGWEARWLRTIHIIAKGAAELGYRFAPKRGVEVLQTYLPLTVELSWAYETWFLRDIAEYLSATSSRGAAIEASERALHRASDYDERDRNVHFSHALVLINTGHAQRAVELLEGIPELNWQPGESVAQQVHETAIWVKALRGVNRGAEADEWLHRLACLAEENHLWQLRVPVQSLLEARPDR